MMRMNSDDHSLAVMSSLAFMETKLSNLLSYFGNYQVFPGNQLACQSINQLKTQFMLPYGTNHRCMT